MSSSSESTGVQTPGGDGVFDGKGVALDAVPPFRSVRGFFSQARLVVEAKLTNEIECVEWCVGRGLIHGKSECRCRRKVRLVRHSGVHGMRWYCGKCNRYESALAGSVFESLHMSIGRALMLIYCFAWGHTYEQVKLACLMAEEDSVIGDATIAGWYDVLRDRLVDYAAAAHADRKIGGAGSVVQVDEALIGRRKYNRGRVIPGTWVVGLIDSAGELRLAVTPNRSKESLQSIILKHVEPESEIHTDSWRGYLGLERLEYQHKMVNHSVEFVAPDGSHTQTIESQWRNLRRKFSRGGIRHETIPEHLIEHVWRRELRRKNQDPFLALLELLKCE